MLAPQMFLRVRSRIVEQYRDLIEREAEFPVEQDLLEPVEITVVVTAVPGPAAPAGREQSDSVVVVQGAHRDSGESGDLSHGVLHGSPLPSPIGYVPSLGPDVT